MGYIFIQDFKGGLDRRRMRATAPAGTLWTCQNAHVSRGGEIEKAKELVELYSMPTGTFGLGYVPGGKLTVFGSDTRPVSLDADIDYQQLEHPDGEDMSAVLCVELYEGKFYVVAEYADDTVHHFYDGVWVKDWWAGLVRAAMSTTDDIAEHLKDLIDADDDFSASRSGDVITITGPVGTDFSVTGTATNGEGNAADDQSLTINTTQSAIESVDEVLASQSFTITAGTASAGVNKITSIKVNGVEILNTAVDWTTSHSGTATAVKDQINAYNSSPEYTAEVNGPTVTVKAAAGTGTGPNGFALEVTTAGNVQVDNIATGTAIVGYFAGGVAAATGQAQITTVEVGGTVEEADEFTVSIEIDGQTRNFGRLNNPEPVANYVHTSEGKIYALSENVLNISGVDTATGWNTSNTGAGFIVMSTQAAGAEELLAIEEYFGQLAILARHSIMLWDMDADVSASRKAQTLHNTGTIAPKSVLNFGENDVFYLSPGGIRSLRARDSSNAAFVSDVGTSIDDLVKELLADLSADEQAACCATVDPVDGRYMLAIGSTIVVFSFFPNSKIAAWSTYAPGVTIGEWVLVENVVYARAGDKIYALGGADGDQYDSANTVVVELPFVDASDPATPKEWVALDMVVEGEWNVYMGFDISNPDAYELVATVSAPTYSMQRVPVQGFSPQAFLRLEHSGEGAARVGHLILHYTKSPDEGSA